MHLHLLEITYEVRDRETVEEWFSQTPLDGVIISIEQYDNEILAVLASEQALGEKLQHVRQHPAISFCEEKRRAVYRVATTAGPEHVLCSFPFREGEEWYLGSGKTAYLCVKSHQLCEKQMSWLTANTDITDWSYLFDLTSVLTDSALK